MAVLDKASVDALLAALYVVNTTGDIEADAALARFRDLLDSYANIAGLALNTIPIKSATDGVLVDGSMIEGADRITASKDFETPPGSLLIGSGLRVSSGLNTLVFQRAGGTQQSLVSMVPYDPVSGSSDPVNYALAAEVEFPVTTVFDTTLVSPQILTFVPAVADSYVTKFRFRPATSGTLRVEGFTGADVDGDLIIDFEITIVPGDIGTEVTMDIPSPALSFVGDQFTIRVSGIDLFGGLQTVPDYTGQTLVFVTLLGYVVTQVQYTTPRTLTSHLSAGDTNMSAAVRTLLENLSADNRLAASAIRGLPADAQLHLSQAVFDNSTRELTFTRDNGSTFAVSIPASGGPAFLQPILTSLSLPGTASRIDTTADLIGDLAIQFHISNNANLASLSLLANSVNVGAVTTFTPDGIINTTVNISAAEWTSITTADNTQVVFQLSGTDTDTPAGTVTSNTVTVQIADVAASEFFYYGLSSSNNPGTVDVATLQSLEAASGTFTLNAIDPAANQWLIFLAPQDHDLTTLVNTSINRNVLPLYTQTTSVRVINGQFYNSYVLGPTNDTVAITYRATLA